VFSVWIEKKSCPVDPVLIMRGLRGFSF